MHAKDISMIILLFYSSISYFKDVHHANNNQNLITTA